MEIECGEYVRTKEYGDIGKLLKITNTKAYLDSIGYAIDRNEIVKHSKNLTDLIEVGDYVNGKYVKEIKQYKDGKSIIALIGIIDEKDIKSIVTKEQMASIEYKVEEDK